MIDNVDIPNLEDTEEDTVYDSVDEDFNLMPHMALNSLQNVVNQEDTYYPPPPGENAPIFGEPMGIGG